jgi:hypothetical protein
VKSKLYGDPGELARRVRPLDPLFSKILNVGWVAKTAFRPSFGLVVEVAIDESLSFTFRLMAYSDYVF